VIVVGAVPVSLPMFVTAAAFAMIIAERAVREVNPM